MAYDVVVVGGGIGGLTVAALLSARGVNTCLLERQSQVGGCVARVEFSGLEFEPGMGIYTSFGAGETYDRLFAELPVDVPKTSLVTRPCVVRLADGTDVRLIGGDSFFDELSARFPECVDEAIRFYRKPALENLTEISPRFESLIAAQVSAFLHASLGQCSSEAIAVALHRPRGPLYLIEGGPATLAERLAESIKRSGGTVRLNTPVLRLAYDSTGQALGVDLLSGETVIAKKAIVSNLTIWDTYGKLVGLNRTPAEIKKLLNRLRGSGAYLIYTSIEPAAVSRLPSKCMLMAAPSTDDEFGEFTLAIQGGTATLKYRTDVDEWFTYHASEEDFEEFDQAALELFWTRLHAALPELGADIEVIETANPLTYYNQTRRKLGMVMGASPFRELSGKAAHTTFLPNLFIVGDTVSPAPTLETVTEAAILLANQLTK